MGSDQQLSNALQHAKERLLGDQDSALIRIDQLEAFAKKSNDARMVLRARGLKAEVLLHNKKAGFADYMKEMEGYDLPGAPQAYAPWVNYYRARWQLGDRKWDLADSLLQNLFKGAIGPSDPELNLRSRIAQLELYGHRKEQTKADSLAEILRPALEMRGDPELLWQYKMAHALAHLNAADPQGAELLYGESLTAADETRLDYAKGLSLKGIAYAQTDQGLFDKAAVSANKADEALVRADDQRDRVEVLKIIGYCYWDKLGPEEVVKRWDLAHAIADSLGMKQEIGMSLLYFAKFRVGLDSAASQKVGYDHAARFDTAMKMIDRAEHIALGLNDGEFIANVVNTRSAILNWQGRFEDALAANRQAHEYFLKKGNGQMATSSLINMASNEIARERWSAAQEMLEKALPMAESGHYNHLRLLALNRLSFTYRKLGLFEKALAYKDRWTDLKDSLDGLDVTAKIAQTELRSSFAKRQFADSLAQAQAMNLEREITMERVNHLRRRSFGLAGGGLIVIVGGSAAFVLDRKRRRERYAKQAAQLEIKALRAQMNPHFIFNALNSISAFIREQDPEKAHGFIARFGRLMRMVLENSRKSEVSLASDLEALGIYLELELARSGHTFDFNITVDPAIDQEETMVPPLVLQPFVENAVWHGMAGQKDRGKVEVNVRMDSNDVVVTICDNGNGMPKSKPVDTGRRSLGTVITKERLDQLAEQKGRPSGFQYMECAKGTCVEVVIPV
ncbi:MAG: histidine kinase [Flavobacteriales bacterium]|nr:histidine kinase [Flavobacteriales bacterium]MBK7241578.1 histidine kinase [Flavobacteriales bacterium]HQV51268.1 histidine kinase [Flavobacteriales bacterium]